MRRELAVVVIEATCDNCGTDVNLIIPSSFRGSYDLADVDEELETEGWVTIDGADFCNLCKPPAAHPASDSRAGEGG